MIKTIVGMTTSIFDLSWSYNWGRSFHLIAAATEGGPCVLKLNVKTFNTQVLVLQN